MDGEDPAARTSSRGDDPRSAITRGNVAEILVDGHRILPSLLADIRAATREIHVSMFLFFRDPIGLEVTRALVERAHAGVKVRVLLNMQKTAMGDPFSTGEKQMMDEDPNVDWDPLDATPICEALTAAGAEVFDTDIDYDRVPSRLEPRLRSMAAQIRGGISFDELHVDHRKIVVIDGRVAYAGGANVGAQYMSHVAFDPAVDARDEAKRWLAEGSPEPWRKWHDSLTRFEGPVVTSIDAHFRDRWILDGGATFELSRTASAAGPDARGWATESAQVLVNEPNGETNAIRDRYVALIAGAERSIFIENPYCYHPAILDALLDAKAQRPSLEITLVLPAGTWNDNAFAHDAQQHGYRALLDAGIAVYEYQRHFTHLKLAVFDERWSIHGSTNLNYRSLEDDKDFELVVVVDGTAFASHLLSHVRDADLAASKRFTLDDVDIGLRGLRVRARDPRTLLLVSRKVL